MDENERLEALASRADGDSVTVDFNRAYNPTCVYNPEYACPLPPQENRLDVPIPAGEKIPKFRSASETARAN
jgi:uncharacterized protein (DUF1684 family)